MYNPADRHRPPLAPPPGQQPAYPFPGATVPRPVTPGQPYHGTMLPPDFILPYRHDPETPMPEYVPEPGETGIVVDASFYRWTFLPYAYLACKPRITVNGQRIPDTSWGANFIPVAPGLHHVRVSTYPSAWAKMRLVPGAPWMELGFADAMMPVRDRHLTRTHYQSSLSKIFAGALGPQPREHFPGRRFYLVIQCIIGVLFAVIAGGILYSALFG